LLAHTQGFSIGCLGLRRLSETPVQVGLRGVEPLVAGEFSFLIKVLDQGQAGGGAVPHRSVVRTNGVGRKPGGFTARDWADKTRALLNSGAIYTPRQAAYDLRKLRGKELIQRVGTSRRFQPKPSGIRTLAALFVLREKVLKPVLAAAGTPKPGRPPKRIHPLDAHYENLQRELRRTLETLGLAA